MKYVGSVIRMICQDANTWGKITPRKTPPVANLAHFFHPTLARSHDDGAHGVRVHRIEIEPWHWAGCDEAWAGTGYCTTAAAGSCAWKEGAEAATVPYHFLWIRRVSYS